jgi:hypothetical protein
MHSQFVLVSIGDNQCSRRAVELVTARLAKAAAQAAVEAGEPVTVRVVAQGKIHQAVAGLAAREAVQALMDMGTVGTDFQAAAASAEAVAAVQGLMGPKGLLQTPGSSPQE